MIDAGLPTITEALALFSTGDLTAEEYLKRCLDAIDEHESEIDAWVSVDRDGALQSARICDQRRGQGQALGTLHGIPIGIKDIVDVAGWPTKAGSQTREDVALAVEDAPLVGNLRAQGAVILGKTVTTEFACFDPPNTRNPIAPQCTPGGSSSGSAAAVAAEMCPAAVGSQTGGSINRPATYCGIAGFKPSLNDVSMDGVIPISADLDHPGPIARTVADLWLVWQAMRGGEPESLPDSSERLNLTVLGGFFEGERCQPEVLSRLRETVSTFVDTGASVIRDELPIDLENMVIQHRRIMAADAAAFHRDVFAQRPDEFRPNISSLIEEGLAIGDDQRRLAGETQESYCRTVREWMGDQVLVAAAANTVPPDPTSTGDPSFNSPWSFLGLPSLSLPMGPVGGLPTGLQLIGQNPRQLFAVARQVELLLFLAEISQGIADDAPDE